MAKHQEHEEHENHERWLVSYADFITLLFAFFVVMYAVSSVDQKRVIQVEKSVRWALSFEGKGGGESVLGFEGSAQAARQARSGSGNGAAPMAARAAQMRRHLASPGDGDARPSVLVLAEGQNLIIRLSATGLFDAGDAILKPTALATLDAVLAEVAATGRRVRVEGHTDAEGSARRFDVNWGLSAARAAAVVTYAQATGSFAAGDLWLGAWGSTRPVATNDTPQGRAENRRIEFVVEMEEGASEGPAPMDQVGAGRSPRN